MGLSLSEILFYAGIITAACSAAAALIYLLVSRGKTRRLNEKLDKEYGSFKSRGKAN